MASFYLLAGGIDCREAAMQVVSRPIPEPAVLVVRETDSVLVVRDDTPSELVDHLSAVLRPV